MSSVTKRPKRKNADAETLSHVASAPAASPGVPLELQQLLLDLFSQNLQLAETANLMSIIQQVKSHLFQRDFASAFGTEDYLTAYALRWSPSRALAYTEIFTGQHVRQRWLVDPVVGPSISACRPPKVVSLGGGAGAEVVALAGSLRQLSLPGLSIHAVDIADWSSVLNKLQVAVETSPTLSPFASASAKAANKPLLESGRLHVHFERQDIFEYNEDQLRALVADASLPGSGFLVVDSPGSYSEVSLSKESGSKRYPMHWLLDHTLLKVAGVEPDGASKWHKCVSDESKWFRLDPKLNYFLGLENMRYQMHVFQRQGGERCTA